MDPVSIDSVLEEFDEDAVEFTEFLRADSLSVELFRLPAGSDDPQDPHTEDEVYYIVEGSAKLRVGDDEHSVEEGDVAFVERGVEHQFFDITEDLTTIVFFTPPYGSLEDE